MPRPSLFNARDKCQWLALAASLLTVTVVLTLTFLWPSGSRASFDTGSLQTSSFAATYQSPRHCRECHSAEFQAWSGTSHADASFDPVFQVFLQKAQRPGECYACHTTGYNSVTGQFALAGVTCEACHGPYREGHSAANMLIASPEELCGTCHTGTLTEWASSRHGRTGVTCTACHEVHSQKTHSADNTNALCAGCHKDQTQDVTHSTHLRSYADVYCVDCHLARPADDFGDAVKGQVATGHSLAVFVSTCSDCHPASLPVDVENP